MVGVYGGIWWVIYTWWSDVVGAMQCNAIHSNHPSMREDGGVIWG